MRRTLKRIGARFFWWLGDVFSHLDYPVRRKTPSFKAGI